MRMCPSCGKQAPEDVQFCPYCGKKVEVEELGNRETASIQEEIAKARHNQRTGFVLAIIGAIVEIAGIVLATITRAEYGFSTIGEYHPYRYAAIGLAALGAFFVVVGSSIGLYYSHKAQNLWKKLTGK